MHGKQINLTGDNINIVSNNFIVDENGNVTANNINAQGTFQNFSQNTGFLAVKINNSKIQLHDYKNNGIKVGEISSTYTPATGTSGIALYAITDKRLTIGYQNEGSTDIHSLFGYLNANEDALPYIKNTASGTLFSGLSGGGITVNNGLIKKWNMSGTFSGNFIVADRNIHVSQGLITGVDII